MSGLTYKAGRSLSRKVLRCLLVQVEIDCLGSGELQYQSICRNTSPAPHLQNLDNRVTAPSYSWGMSFHRPSYFRPAETEMVKSGCRVRGSQKERHRKSSGCQIGVGGPWENKVWSSVLPHAPTVSLSLSPSPFLACCFSRRHVFRRERRKEEMPK